MCAYKRISPQPVTEGGTGAQTLGLNGVLIGNTTSAILATTAGTTGQVLTGVTGLPPTFQSLPASSITADGDSGSASGSTITWNANSNSGATVQFSASGSTVDLLVSNNANSNTFIGNTCGNTSLSGQFNTGLGTGLALSSLTTADFNIGIGHGVLQHCTQGAANVGIGYTALNLVTTGQRNTAVGMQAFAGSTYNGSYSVGVGYQAGVNYTGSESSNILLNNPGTASESNVCRIGAGTGTGTQQLSKSFISGINGVTSSNPLMVTINSSTDQLGVAAIPVGGVSSVTGTSNQVTASPTTGAVVLSTPSTFIAPGSIAASTTLTATSGNITATSGNIAMTAATTASVGNFQINGVNVVHPYGTNNFFAGINPGNYTLTGNENVGIGQGSLGSCTGGSYNTAVGVGTATYLTEATYSVAIGYGALGGGSTTGGQNVAIGLNSLSATTSGGANVSIGPYAMSAATITGAYNVAIGYDTLAHITSGSSNVVIGQTAGANYTSSETSNIVIGPGTYGTTGESNITRIGTSQLGCYISGIQTIGIAGTPVLVSTSDQLGVAVSSRKYKENINDMGSLSNYLMKLRPVTFNYKFDESKTNSYGLIAEEVADIMPDLVTYDKSGDPLTVKYHELPALLLNEIQKLRRELNELKEARNGCS